MPLKYHQPKRVLALLALVSFSALADQRIDCHGLANYKTKKAPRFLDSHLAISSDGKTKSLSMERYQCNSCHVAQVDAKPLVVNTFARNVRTKK